MTTDIATIDFETRNVSNSKLLQQYGAWNYSKHPSTVILCLAYKLPTNTTIKYWYNNKGFSPSLKLKEMTPPQDLLEYVESGGLIEAHNVFFERCIWTNCAVPSLSWPEVAPEQWRCSMAKALACALPKSLAAASQAIDLSEEKDSTGQKLMLNMTSSYVYDNIVNIKKLLAYCIQDVKTEIALSAQLPELLPIEQKIWLEDFEMNWRGVKIDMPFVDKAIQHSEYYSEMVNTRLYNLIGVPRTTMRARIREWFEATKCPINNTQKEYLQMLSTNPPSNFKSIHKEIIRLMLANNLSSLAKYKKIINYVDRTDNRIRANTIYHGGHTGRYTSVGVQLHNFPRETISDIDNIIQFAKVDSSKDFALRTKKLGGAGSVLSKLIRGVIIPSTSSNKLIVSDYSAIEVHILFWITNEIEALNILAAGEDIYCAFSSRIFRRSITKTDKKERQLGKQAVLGLGYGMGWYTFLQTLRKYNIFLSSQECKDILKDDYNTYYMEIVNAKNYSISAEDRPEAALCKYIVDIYRSTYLNVVNFWKAIEHDFVNCKGKVSYKKPFIKYKLPSGKELYYPYPKRVKRPTPWGDMRYEFSAALVHGSKFVRSAFYGGKLTENIVQATAREVLVRAILNIRNSKDYTMVHHAHDEIIAEALNPNIEEFNKLMIEVGPKFSTCPLSVETHICNRWQKF